MNDKWGRENPYFHHKFSAKYFTETYANLCKRCRGMTHPILVSRVFEVVLKNLEKNSTEVALTDSFRELWRSRAPPTASSGFRAPLPPRLGRRDREAVWRSRFLISIISAHDLVNQVKHVTLVKPWSTWVITSKTYPTITNDHLNQVNTHFWWNICQRHSQTLFKPLMSLSLL
jgi:hypothetical protein